MGGAMAILDEIYRTKIAEIDDAINSKREEIAKEAMQSEWFKETTKKLVRLKREFKTLRDKLRKECEKRGFSLYDYMDEYSLSCRVGAYHRHAKLRKFLKAKDELKSAYFKARVEMATAGRPEKAEIIQKFAKMKFV